MNDKRTYSHILGLILFCISGLLVLRVLPEIFAWNSPATNKFGIIFTIVWPVLGVLDGIEFLGKDKTGWGGILFHLVILYALIGYTVQGIIDVVNAFQQSGIIVTLIVDISIAALGWLAFFYYYD
nr:hypothetical protein [Candidatus Sigynarchaeota archaeon]